MSFVSPSPTGAEKMLGLLKPEKLELLVKDVLYYKLYYCSVCRRLTNVHNRAHAFLNSYEGTLLALLYNEMVVQDSQAVKDRCTGIPIVKVAVLAPGHPAVELGAFVSLLAFQFKFRDDLADEAGFWSRQGSHWLLGQVEHSLAKDGDLFVRFNIDRKWIETRHRDLVRLEREAPRGDTSPHLRLWGEIFSYVMSQPFENKIAPPRFAAMQEFFAGLGRVIHLLDSMSDLHPDHAAHKFNLILNDADSPRPDDEPWLRQAYGLWSAKVNGERQALLACLQRLDLRESWPIVHNILTHCLDKELRKVFELMVLKKTNTEKTLFNCKDF